MPPPYISKSWFDPFALRERLRRLAARPAPAAKRRSVMLTLESLEIIALPNNLLAAGVFSDPGPAPMALIAPTADMPSDGSSVADPMTTSLTPDAAPATADPTAVSVPYTTTPYYVASNAFPTADSTAADVVFQSGFADLYAPPISDAIFNNPLPDATQADASATPAAATVSASDAASTAAAPQTADAGSTPSVYSSDSSANAAVSQTSAAPPRRQTLMRRRLLCPPCRCRRRPPATLRPSPP